MRDLGLIKAAEPFRNLLTQGMVLNSIYFRKPASGRVLYFNPSDIEITLDDQGNPSTAILRSDGEPVESGGIGTMSKSKNNGVDPQALMEDYGADIARFYMMFTAPPEQTLEWSDASVEGAARFLKRVWTLGYDTAQRAPTAPSLPAPIAQLPSALVSVRRDIHALLKQANYDLGRHQFNTVASATMKMLNTLESVLKTANDPSAHSVLHEGLSILLRVLSPITPHITHQLWQDLGYGIDILSAPWPEPDAAALVENEIEWILQINGKKRGSLRAPVAISKPDIEAMALAHPDMVRHIAHQPVQKVIVVPGRLVNVVVRMNTSPSEA
jgi:leucyl-tRNA synthetase